MEGDVLLNSAPSLFLATGVIGGVVAVLKWFSARILADIERRFERIDQLDHDLKRIDDDFKRFIAEMPLHYQRREDSIREYTAINAKLDRQWEVMAEMSRRR